MEWLGYLWLLLAWGFIGYAAREGWRALRYRIEGAND